MIPQERRLRQRPSYHERARVIQGNTDFSVRPGMTVYVTPESRAKIARVNEKCGYDPLDVTYITDNIEALTYPDGVYGMGGLGGFELWQHATPSEDDTRGWKTRRNVVNGPYEMIIRVEGHSGEVWQNFDYSQEGRIIESLKPRPQGKPAQ